MGAGTASACTGTAASEWSASETNKTAASGCSGSVSKKSIPCVAAK